MRKKIFLSAIMISTFLSINVLAEERSEKEILFRDIPWGTNFLDTANYFEGYDLWDLSGDWTVNPSVDGVLLNNDNEGIDFEYNDINIIGNLYPGEMEVAGYTTKDVELHFAYTFKDDMLLKNKYYCALYGATYVFEPLNLEEMTQDLIAKLSSIYGDYAKESTDRDLFGSVYKYYYWYGVNDTELVLVSETVSEDMAELLSDTISISYAWRKGDELLQEANDYLKNEDINAEASSYGDSNTSGL